MRMNAHILQDSCQAAILSIWQVLSVKYSERNSTELEVLAGI